MNSFCGFTSKVVAVGMEASCDRDREGYHGRANGDES
jgi:hypothetical protein